MTKARWGATETELIRQQWSDLGTSQTTALLRGRTPRAVEQKAQSMGLKCNFKEKYRRISETAKNSNVSCDTNYFCREWSKNMAYIIGYILADGCITKGMRSLSFICHQKDEEILLAIKKELKSNHKIVRHSEKIYEDGRRNGPRTCLSICSKKIAESLVTNFGIFPRKTWLDSEMPNVPDQFFGHFLRGYIDGDGHVSIREVCGRKYGRTSFVATYKIATAIRDRVCKMLGVSLTKVLQQGIVWCVEWARHQDLVAISNLLYPPGEYIYLGRKRQVFEQIAKLEPIRLQRNRLPAPSLN